MKPRWFPVFTAILMLALFSSLTVPAAAATPAVKLVLGSTGTLPWAIGSMAPGDSGNQTVTLSNTGSQDGVVTIWISDIVNSEGLNPEPESGDTAEPGELGDYLILNVSGTNAAANFTLPAKIADFPMSAADAKHIYINPLKAFSTLSLQWAWQVPLATGNIIQGDILSCTINYRLEEFPPAPCPPLISVDIIKTGPPGVITGLTGSYTLTVTNTGETALNGVTVTDYLPEILNYESSVPAGTVSGNQITWNFCTLNIGETQDIVTLLRGVKEGTGVNTATVTTCEGVTSTDSLNITVADAPEPPAPYVPQPPAPAPYSPPLPYSAPSGGTAANAIPTPEEPAVVSSKNLIVSLQTTPDAKPEQAAPVSPLTTAVEIPRATAASVDSEGENDTSTLGTLPSVLPAASGTSEVLSGWLRFTALLVIGAAALVYGVISSRKKRL